MRRVGPIHSVARVAVLPALSILMAWTCATVQAQAAGDAKPQSLADLGELKGSGGNY